MTPGDEVWDLYTTDRVKASRAARRGDPIPAGLRHLVVYAAIFNSKGELLIQRRQLCKRGSPGKWDISVGGSALTGEDSRDAIEREAREELGLTLALDDACPHLSHYVDSFILDTFVVTRDVALSSLSLQPEEVMDVRWATLPEVFAMIDDDLFITYHKAFIELLFAMRARRGMVA